MDRRPGRVTAHELIAHSVESLPPLSRRFFSYQEPQEPMAFALGADFLLRGRVGAAFSSAATP